MLFARALLLSCLATLAEAGLHIGGDKGKVIFGIGSSTSMAGTCTLEFVPAPNGGNPKLKSNCPIVNPPPAPKGPCGDSTSNGVTTVTVNEDEVEVYCDVESLGGPWVLVQTAMAQNPNQVDLRTADAVGGTPMPMSTNPGSAKLSRSTIASLYSATGDKVGLKWGKPNCDWLFARNLDDECITTGCHTTGASEVYGANRISYVDPACTTENCLDPQGTTWPHSRFGWPSNQMPSACLNPNNANGECALGCHIGSWDGGTADKSYWNDCNCDEDEGYEVWVYVGAD
jgi:hypothetical protein